MNREDFRSLQCACVWTIMMTGGLALVMKLVGIPIGFWGALAGVSIFHSVILFCFVLQHGWMPKDRMTIEDVVKLIEEEKLFSIEKRNSCYANIVAFKAEGDVVMAQKRQEEKYMADAEINVLCWILEAIKQKA